MQYREFTDGNGTTYRRINRRQAHNMFNQGNDIVICAVNMRPFTPWHVESTIMHELEKDWFDTGIFEDFFEYYVTSFTVYNCTCNETGYYPAFYVAC